MVKKIDFINITSTNLDDLLSCYMTEGEFPKKYAYGIEVLKYVGIINNVLVYKGKKEYFICNTPPYLMSLADRLVEAYKEAKNFIPYDGFEEHLNTFLENIG